jgi:cell surface protein SprA
LFWLILEKHEFSLANYPHKISKQPNYITPFNKIIKSQSKYLKIIKSFNFNPAPNSINFNTGVNRRFSETTYRFAGDVENSTWFDKRFMWDSVYGVQ